MPLAVSWRPLAVSVAGQAVWSYGGHCCTGSASLRTSVSPVSNIPSLLCTHLSPVNGIVIIRSADELHGVGSSLEDDSHLAVFCGTGRFTTGFKSFLLLEPVVSQFNAVPSPLRQTFPNK